MKISDERIYEFIETQRRIQLTSGGFRTPDASDLIDALEELANYRRTFAQIEEMLRADDSREVEFGLGYATLTRHYSAASEAMVEECDTPFAALSALVDSIIREELERKEPPHDA